MLQSDMFGRRFVAKKCRIAYGGENGYHWVFTCLDYAGLQMLRGRYVLACLSLVVVLRGGGLEVGVGGY